MQWFAESLGATEENGQFTLIPVRPDWSDSSDLLGYVNLQGEFQERPLIKVLENADANPNIVFCSVGRDELSSSGILL